MLLGSCGSERGIWSSQRGWEALPVSKGVPGQVNFPFCGAHIHGGAALGPQVPGRGALQQESYPIG